MHKCMYMVGAGLVVRGMSAGSNVYNLLRLVDVFCRRYPAIRRACGDVQKV